MGEGWKYRDHWRGKVLPRSPIQYHQKSMINILRFGMSRLRDSGVGKHFYYRREERNTM